MNPRLFLIAALLSSAACSDAAEMEETIGASSEARTPATAAAAAANGAGRALAERTEEFEFEYSWPAEAAAIPALDARLQSRADAARGELIAGAQDDRAAAAEAGYSFRPHSFSGEWQVVANLPGWLSLSEAISTYAGGAHPNSAFGSLLWDKGARLDRAPLDLFRSPRGFENAIAGRFCAMLDAERGERRGEPVVPNADDYFTGCPRIEEITVLLGSSNGETFDRIAIVIPPYVAGPYAEGAYEFDLPVDTAVLDAVRPEFRQAFSLGPQS